MKAFFNDRQLVSAESGHIDLQHAESNADTEPDNSSGDSSLVDSESTSLAPSDASSLAKWLEESLSDKVTEVRVSERLTDSPAMITDHQSAALQRMMRFVNQQAKGGATPAQGMPKMAMEVNPTHPIICQLNAARMSRPDVAKLVAEQVFDNALIAAGLLEDSRFMLPRLNSLLEGILGEDMK